MIIALAQLFSVGEAAVWTFSLLFIRVGAAMALLPAFGEQAVPARVKTALAVCFAAFLTPMVWAEIGDALTQASWFRLIGGEVVAGLIIGILFRFLIFALQLAGSIAAQSTSLAQLFGGGLGPEPQPAFSTLLVVAGICFATMLGLHVRVIEAFLLSYELFPVGVLTGAGELADWGVARVSRVFGLGFSLAGPFIVVALVYNVGLGVINKAMPQLMVAFVGAPAISLGSLVLLLVASPVMLVAWGEAFKELTQLDALAR